MISTLSSCRFDDVELQASCSLALLEAKHRALAILHDCPAVLPAATQFFNQISILPAAEDLKYRQPGAEEWLACGVKALIEADTSLADRAAQLERYAARALENAGRILKHQQGLQGGYEEHVGQVTAERKANLQKAEVAKKSKGRATHRAIIDCYDEVIKERGNQSGNQAEVARRLKITPARVSQVLGKR